MHGIHSKVSAVCRCICGLSWRRSSVQQVTEYIWMYTVDIEQRKKEVSLHETIAGTTDTGEPSLSYRSLGRIPRREASGYVHLRLRRAH